MKPLSLLYPTGVLLGIFIGAACRVPQPNHCSANEGDATCATLEQGSYCDGCQPENDGCVDEMPSSECYVPGPEDASTGGDDTTGGEETMAPLPMTADPAGDSTGAATCASDEDCMDPGAPFCDPSSGVCVACDAIVDSNGACAGRDAGAPLCVGGECVECTPENPTICDADRRLCDGATNNCVSCTMHDQCSSGACELAEGEGRCFPSDVVVHVDGDGGRDYTLISEAISNVEADGFGILVVHELDGGSLYSQGVHVDEGKIIAMLAAPGESPILQGTLTDPSLRAVEEASLYVEGLRIRGNEGGLGVEANGALVWLDRSRIVENEEGGIWAHGAASLTLRNSFVGGGVDVVGVDVDGASADILYSTIATSTLAMPAVPSLRCTETNDIVIRNSIVVSYGGPLGTEIDCEGASVTQSATEIDVGACDPDWFANFNSGEFLLTAEGAGVFEDIAQWKAGDPETDIDGDDRPTMDGATDHPGADRPPS